MTVWERSHKTFFYHLIPAIIWNVVFWMFFSIRYVFRSLDVITNPALIPEEIPRAVLCIITVIMAVISTDKFLGVLLNMHRIGEQDEVFESLVGCSAGIDGVQGIGKTRLMIYMSMCVQPQKWRELQYSYYVDCPISASLEKDFKNGNREKYIRFMSRRDSVNAYNIDGSYIPLIYSNIAVNYKNKRNRILKKEHFTQKERLYESNIKIGSELDNMLHNSMRTKKNIETEEDLEANLIDEFAGLDRQYTGGLLLADTHRNGALFQPVRDCQQVKFHLLESKYMYPAKIYKALLGLVKDGILARKEKTTMLQHRLAKWLEARCKYIGFTKIYYIEERGPERLASTTERKFFILPNEVPYAYDDRNLQKDYLPLGYRNRPTVPEKPKKTKQKGETVPDKM